MIKKVSRLLVSLLLVFLFLGEGLITAVLAQGELSDTFQDGREALADIPTPTWNLDLTVSPVSINLETIPGESVTTVVKVKNNGNGPEYLQIDVAKFIADETGARPQILDIEAGDSFVNWLYFSEDSFVVNSGEWKSIEVTFAPPQDAALGYYITLIFNRQRVVDPDARQTVITGAPAILVLANVNSPNAKKELSLVDFSVSKHFYEYLPATFTVGVKNTGNIHVVPVGNIFIDHGEEKDVAILSINEAGGNILAESERSYEVNWLQGFPIYVDKTENDSVVYDENGDVVKKLQWNLGDADKIRIGKYTAHLLMVYDNGERDVPIESSIEFWVVPWRLILLGLLNLAIVLGFFVLLIHVLKGRRKR